MRLGFDIGLDGDCVLVRSPASPTPTPTPAPAPSWSVQPSISGIAIEGQTLTGSDGTIANGTVSARAWLRAGSAISGATGASYGLTSADVGTAISYRVTASGAGGTTQATSAATTSVTSLPTTVPADWRMPATVTTSAGLSSAAAALTTAQASASAKTRPTATVLAGATDHIEWTVGAAGIAILSWLGQSAGTATVTQNGANQSFTTAVPSGSTIDGVSGTGGRRQFMKLAVASGDTIRLTIAAGAADRTIRPLLHKLPDAGPWDAHIVFGASREATGLGCQLIEDAVIAGYPTRDPIVFSFAVSGASLSGVQAQATSAAPIYAGAAPYALIGSAPGNDITGGRPYTSGQKAALDSGFTAICTTLTGAGYTLGFANTSYLAYSGVSVTSQSGGSLPYNDNVVHPMIATHAAHCYDASLKRSRIDDYLNILFYRSALSDEVHSAYTEMRSHWAATWFNYVATGAWPASQAEQRVATAEANATTDATALSTFNEATYALAALEAGSAKTALKDRMDLIEPTTLFYEAKRLITVAEGAPSTETKATAQTALNAAVTAGYSGGTAPNTVAAQQARLDAITVSSYDQIVQFRFGSSGAVTGWNASAATDGTHTANALDSNGNATGISLVLSRPVGSMTSGTQASGPSTMPDFPDAILDAFIAGQSVRYFATISGLDPAKSYDVSTANTRVTASSNNTRVTVQAGNASTTLTATPQTVLATNNTTTLLNFNSVTPSASAQIVVEVFYSTGTSFGYLSGLTLKRKV